MLRPLATWCATATGWRSLLLLAGAGGVATLALPPWGLVGVLVPGFVVLVWSLVSAQTSRGVFWRTWIFATAHFAPALWWVSQSMITKGGPAVYMVPVAAIGLPMMLALFPAVLMTILARFSKPDGVFIWAMVVALGWSLSEGARSYLFTGFPWHLLGYVWLDMPALAQSLSVLGVLGVGLLTVLAACSMAVWAHWSLRSASLLTAVIACLITGAALWGQVRLHHAEFTDAEPPMVRVVQPNVPQREKWLPETRARQITDLIRLSGAPGVTDVDFILWPETSITFDVERDPRLLSALGALLLPEQSVLAGKVSVKWRDGQLEHLLNSMVLIDDTGAMTARYDKRHLVPFGEYLPFRSMLEPFGVTAVASKYDFSVGRGPQLIEIPGLGLVRVLICYEAIFPHHLVGMTRPDVLVVGTNDAWFGDTAGPQQHAAMSRARALEWGVPMVRSANTGISLIADAFGREVTRIEINQQGQLTERLPQKLRNAPIYAKWGDLFYFVLILVALTAVFFKIFIGRYLSSHVMRA